MEIKIVRDSITKKELADIASAGFGDMVKIVVDVEHKVMAVGGELHADEEVVLSEQCGSKRAHTWGINIYPEKSGDDMIEFNSMVNIKPALGNRSREVENQETREKIKTVIRSLVTL